MLSEFHFTTDYLIQKGGLWMKKRNILVNLIFLFVLVFALNVNVSAQEKEVPEGYTGIYTIADLWGIRNDTAGNYILMNDIDLTEATKEGGEWDTGNGWVPIPSFSGVLDGNGYQIIGMNVYGEVETYYVGLFERISGGTVQNLGMKDVTINVSSKRYNFYVGSLAGRLGAGQIENCYCSGEITNTHITSDYTFTGGLVGYNESIIKQCVNMAKVTAESDYVAGIAGHCYYSDPIKNCYNIGEISGGSWRYGISDYCGGNNYYLSGTVTQSSTVSGVSALTSTQMKYAQSFTGFDFDNIWEIDSYCNYPYPQLKDNRYIRVEKMELISAPSKLTYKQGDVLSLSGASVKMYYDDGYDTTIVPTKDMLSDYDMNIIGTQTISICRGDKKVSFDIEVEGIEAASIKLNQTQMDIQKGKTTLLTASILPENTSDKTVEWSSEDTSIATVSDTGLVTAKKAGKTVITARTTNGLIAKCYVTVKVPSIQLFLDKEQIEVMKGETEVLSATLSPLDSTDQIVWSSDNSQIATVIDGTVIGKQAGKTTVRAQTDSGIVKTCTVIVKQFLSEFKVAGIEDKQYTGGQIKQNLNVYNGNVVLKEGVDYTVSYNNNINVGVATICVTGKNYYIGDQVLTFHIDKNTIANVSVKLSYLKCTYDGTQKCPGVTVAVNGQKLIAGKDYDCTYISNNAPGTAYVSITGKGNFTGSKQVAYTIAMPKTNLKKVSALKKKKVQVTYSSVKGASGYQIQYSTKKNFAGSKIKTTKKATQKITGLKKGKKYYFRVRVVVRANGKNYYSGWSKTKTVKVKK